MITCVSRLNYFRLACVELAVEASVRNCARTYSCVCLVVSCTEPVGSTVNVSDESLALCVVCVNGGSSCFVSTVNVCTGNYAVDVCLNTRNHSVEVVTTLSCLEIYVDSFSVVSCGIHVVTVHVTLEVVNLTVVKLALNHTELVCSAYNGINYTGSRSFNNLVTLALFSANSLCARSVCALLASFANVSALVSRLFCCTCNANNNCCVLKLRNIVMTDYGENCDSIANNGSVASSYHCIISVTSLVVATVNINLVASFVLDVKVTILSICNLNYLTSDKVLVFCCGSLILESTCNCVSIFDRSRSCECKNPTVLNLSCAIVMTNYTKNYNVVTCNGLGFKSVVSLRAVCTVCTVDGKDVAVLVCDLHVTVCCVINFSNNTGNDVLISCVNIVLTGESKSNDVCNSSRLHRELNCEFLSLGYVAASNGNSNLCSSTCSRNCKSDLVTINNCVFAVGCPRDSNVVIVLTNGKNVNNSAGSYSSLELKLCKLCINLFLSCLLNELEVSEAVCGHRNEVRIAGVKDKDTGYVCCVAEVISVCLIDSSLVCVICSSSSSIKSGGEISYVCSYVRVNASDGEIEVLAGSCCKILRTDCNALNCYRESYELGEVGVTSENVLGDINNVNSLDGLVNDSECTALDLLHAGVGLDRTGNRNCHTNLNACFNGILIHLVGVVTALTACICKEEVVSGVTEGLSVHSNYDTFNKYCIALSSCHVVSPRKNVVLRNSTVVNNSCCVTVTSCDGSGKSVGSVLGSLLVKVNEIVTIFKSYDLNLIAIGSPSYCVSNACYSNLTNYFVVSAGYRRNVLIHVLEEGLSLVNVVLFNGGLFAADDVLELIKKTLNIAGGEYSEAHNECQKKR